MHSCMTHVLVFGKGWHVTHMLCLVKGGMCVCLVMGGMCVFGKGWHVHTECDSL